MSRALLGDIEISVVRSDNPNHRVAITDKPVERGQDISDHVRPMPATIKISGIIVGPDAEQKFQKLKQYQREGQMLTYINRTSYTNVVIENIETIYDATVENGFKFTMSLKQVRVAEAKAIAVTNVPPNIQTKTRGSSKAGMKQPDKKETLLDKLKSRGD